ncbi:MAG: hypothetical protein KDA90_00760 [Planctomycetaceae bacterium]|nr:hypothetical protein [Planctomycetaceae bacterium]
MVNRCLLSGFLVLLLCGISQAEPRSIEEFMSFKDKWPQLASATSTWNLEGRYGFIGKEEMRFAQCPLKFLLPPDTRITTRNSNVVEVVGSLRKDGNDIVFEIRKLSSRPSDLTTLGLKRAALVATDPQAWYGLGDWAIGRGSFYSDEELKFEARKLYLLGVETERGLIKTGDFAALQTLARKAMEYSLHSEVSRDLKHQAHRERFDIAKTQPKANLSELILLLKEDLPAAGRPLSFVNPELVQAYSKDPVKAYTAASPQTRDQYDRLFAVELEMLRITRDIKPDGSNGNAIADRIATFVPERTELVDPYRVNELNYHVSRIPAMTRQEMLDLAAKFEQRNEPERVIEVKQSWLKARETRLRRDGARGLCELAEDWITLLEDYETARSLYIEAYKTNPGYPPSSIWLEANGYVLHQNKWIPKDQAPPDGDAAMLAAIQQGRVLMGMTEAQVRSALGTIPTSTLRFARSRGSTELLVFETAGLVIRLDRQNHIEPSRVVEIRSHAAPAKVDESQ